MKLLQESGKTSTCDFSSIRDMQDETMHTHLICTVKREASLKALFMVKDDELTFQKAVELAQEIEEVTKVIRKPITLQRTADS